MKNGKKLLSRRQFTKLGATAIAAAAVGANQMASAQTPASELESAFLMELSIRCLRSTRHWTHKHRARNRRHIRRTTIAGNCKRRRRRLDHPSIRTLQS